MLWLVCELQQLLSDGCCHYHFQLSRMTLPQKARTKQSVISHNMRWLCVSVNAQVCSGL